MKSYACVDRLEGNFAVCEVELVPVEESVHLDPFEKETTMIDVPVEAILLIVEEFSEADILLVEHDGCNVTTIYGKDENERQRRADTIAALMSDN